MRSSSRKRHVLGRPALLSVLLAAVVQTGPAHASAAGGGGGVPSTFRAATATNWGQQVFVTGDAESLGAWDPALALPLDAAAYPTWSGETALPAGTAVQYKYFIRNPDGSVIWEEGLNRTLTAWADSPVTTTDRFRFSSDTPASGTAPTCVTASSGWRYTFVRNDCGTPYELQVIYRDGSESGCRHVPPGSEATFPGYGTRANHPVAIRHC
ncbi:carbohydrate-binding module family 20 domain-containing protein [Streptomyces sp. NPDC002187]|uniref:carbohydrate-binding module family 20 domain-containing protein n=1 Tax=Streptomyces sp. NPDC002187 TaxID=3364637 RepID=UPI0036B933C3